VSEDSDAFDRLADALDSARDLSREDAFKLLHGFAVTMTEDTPRRRWFMTESAKVVELEDVLAELAAK